MTTVEMTRATVGVIAHGIAVSAQAIARTTRRLIRTVKAIITVSRRHLPAWLGAVLAVALAIPGPQDELLVMLVIGVFVAVKPAMRADIVSATRNAWKD